MFCIGLLVKTLLVRAEQQVSAYLVCFPFFLSDPLSFSLYHSLPTFLDPISWPFPIRAVHFAAFPTRLSLIRYDFLPSTQLCSLSPSNLPCTLTVSQIQYFRSAGIAGQLHPSFALIKTSFSAAPSRRFSIDLYFTRGFLTEGGVFS